MSYKRSGIHVNIRKVFYETIHNIFKIVLLFAFKRLFYKKAEGIVFLNKLNANVFTCLLNR